MKVKTDEQMRLTPKRKDSNEIKVKTNEQMRLTTKRKDGNGSNNGEKSVLLLSPHCWGLQGIIVAYHI